MLPNTSIRSHCSIVWTPSTITTREHVDSSEYAIQKKDHQPQPVSTKHKIVILKYFSPTYFKLL